MKNYNDIEFTLHAIISGVLLNGFIQGSTKEKIDIGIVKEALKEIKKILNR